MTALLPLLEPLLGPLIALAAGVAGWSAARRFAPAPAANDDLPRAPSRRSPGQALVPVPIRR